MLLYNNKSFNPFRLSYLGNWVTTISDFSPINSPILPIIKYSRVHQLRTIPISNCEFIFSKNYDACKKSFLTYFVLFFSMTVLVAGHRVWTCHQCPCTVTPEAAWTSYQLPTILPKWATRRPCRIHMQQPWLRPITMWPIP